MRCTLILLCVLALSACKGTDNASTPKQKITVDYTNLNTRCQTYIPILLEQWELLWPTMENPSIFCAQIDQETCAGQKSKSCWSPNARLKTSREEGYGLGQITRAWNNKKELRFDVLQELRDKHQSELAGWSWKNVSDALFQIKALILLNYDNFRALPEANSLLQKYAFMDAAYNGGLSGVLSEIKMCKQVEGCDSGEWFNNVEHYSKKSKKAASGYKNSFFYINRQHVKNVIYDRRERYIQAGIK